MTNSPAPAIPAGDTELFDLAARLAGVQTVDLVHASRRADGTLVVLLATGAKYTFDPSQIIAQLGTDAETWLRSQIPFPPPAPPAAKPKRAR